MVSGLFFFVADEALDDIQVITSIRASIPLLQLVENGSSYVHNDLTLMVSHSLSVGVFGWESKVCWSSDDVLTELECYLEDSHIINVVINELTPCLEFSEM
jgi:hypothetical protein